MSRRTSLVTVLVGVVLAVASMLFIWQAVAASPPSLGEPLVVTGQPSPTPYAPSATADQRAEPVSPPPPSRGGDDDDDDD